jgi:large subunit ribosomal protein L24
MATRIKKGDTVYVISGKDKGKTGQVAQVMPETDMVIVTGINMVTKHRKPTQRQPEGARFQKEAALHACKVMPLDPTTGKPTRVRSKMDGDKKVRIAKSGATIA